MSTPDSLAHPEEEKKGDGSRALADAARPETIQVMYRDNGESAWWSVICTPEVGEFRDGQTFLFDLAKPADQREAEQSSPSPQPKDSGARADSYKFRFAIGDKVFVTRLTENNEMHRLPPTIQADPTPYTVGQLRVEITDSPDKPQRKIEEAYMFVETGIGSGQVWSVDKIAATYEDAKSLAEKREVAARSALSETGEGEK